jgi:hypothetical protein
MRRLLLCTLMLACTGAFAAQMPVDATPEPARLVNVLEGQPGQDGATDPALALPAPTLPSITVSDQSDVHAYVVDAMPGQEGQPTRLIPSTVWEGTRITRSADGVCTQTVQRIEGFSEESKVGVTVQIPLLNTVDSVVNCPS